MVYHLKIQTYLLLHVPLCVMIRSLPIISEPMLNLHNRNASECNDICVIYRAISVENTYPLTSTYVPLLQFESNTPIHLRFDVLVSLKWLPWVPMLSPSITRLSSENTDVSPGARSSVWYLTQFPPVISKSMLNLLTENVSEYNDDICVMCRVIR